LVPEVRYRLRREATPATTAARRHLAPRRSVHPHPRRAALPVAHGVVLDILVQERRNGTAAKRFFKQLLGGLGYKPRRLVTDGLRSYGVAQRAILPDVRHRTSRYLNNRAENSHRPTRRRERQMQRFKSSDEAQRFLSTHSMIYGHFRPRRHLIPAADYRRARSKAFRIWRQETCVHQSA
jgi:putative transposase